MGETVRPDGELASSGSDRVRSGPVRSAVDRIVRDRAGARTIRAALRELPAELVVDALLAQRYAGIVDRAVKADDDARVVAAGEKLRGVLERLQPKAPKGGAADDGDSGSDGGGQLYSILDRGPTVGHGAHA